MEIGVPPWPMKALRCREGRACRIMDEVGLSTTGLGPPLLRRTLVQNYGVGKRLLILLSTNINRSQGRKRVSKKAKWSNFFIREEYIRTKKAHDVR